MEQINSYRALRCENNIGIDLRKIGLEGVDWMHLAEDRNH
jgi:hypothetical protein